ncbi:MAG: phage tail tape measure protein [Campylobacteraceae bacterium]|jgi:TP901 family phage tail tape measure protein|nr:phage tail tape measure protein [Campylobacteraceae bacterium]
MKDVMLGISLGLAVKGVQKLIETNKSFDNLRKIAKQTDAGIKGLSGTLVAYHKNLVKINYAQQQITDAKSKIFNMKNLVMGGAIAAPFKAAIDFESAMSDVKKVVDFASEAEEKLYTKQIKGLSRVIPLEAKQLATIMAAGGALGVQKEELAKFTETVAKMSVAFDMDAENAGKTMAKIMSVYQVGIDDAASIADAINKVSNTIGVNAGDMTEVMTRVGGNAKVFKLTAEQTTALAGSFLSLGKSPQVAGTAINALLSKMKTAELQGTEFQDALKEMGTDAKTLADSIKMNPQVALETFLEQLERVDGDKQLGIFKKLMGEGYSDDMALLVSSLGQYKKALESVSEKSKYAGSVEAEFAKKAKDTAAQLIFMKNSINEVGIEIGSALLPVLNDFLRFFKSVVYPLADFIREHQELTKVIAGTFSVLFAGKLVYQTVKLIYFSGKFYILGFANALKFLWVMTMWATSAEKIRGLTHLIASARTKGATGSVIFLTAVLKIATLWQNRHTIALKLSSAAIKTYAAVSAFLSGGIKKIIIAIRSWTIVQTILNAIMTANPIGLIIVGIGLLVAAIVWVSNKMGGFGNLCKAVWERIKTVFSWSPLGLLMRGIGVAFDWLGSKFEWINGLTEYFSSLWEGVKGFFSDIASWFGFGGGDVSVSNDAPDVYNESMPAYSYENYAMPSATAQTTGGGSINVNFSGNFMIGSKPDGTFNFDEFKKELVKAVKDSIKTDNFNAQNRRF